MREDSTIARNVLCNMKMNGCVRNSIPFCCEAMVAAIVKCKAGGKSVESYDGVLELDIYIYLSFGYQASISSYVAVKLLLIIKKIMLRRSH